MPNRRIVDLTEMPNFDWSTNNGRGTWSAYDVTTGQVKLSYDEWNKPECCEHGAMNAVNRDRTIWRCVECGRACYMIWGE